jgi:hypothetical protein
MLAICGMLTGCLEEKQPARTTPVFSHKLHVVGQEMKCVACHKVPAKGEQNHMTMPTVKSCMKCHDGIDPKKEPAHRVEAFVKDGNPVWSKVTALPAEVKFSHKNHIDAKVECATCHQGIENSKEVSSRLRVDMKGCMDCHAKTKVTAKASNNCASCHTTISKEWKPENHSKDWTQLHGREIGFAAQSSTATCNLCHTQQSCLQCHKDQPPKNHTNFWRERGHGVTADLDPKGCKVCHTEDSCVRCHQTIAPKSHRANFESQHCVGCHEPLKDNGCFACHKNTRSHATAPNAPSNKVHEIATANTCRDCHFGLKMKHLDNGDSCLNCHRK